jgi:hypothetical protein
MNEYSLGINLSVGPAFSAALIRFSCAVLSSSEYSEIAEITVWMLFASKALISELMSV